MSMKEAIESMIDSISEKAPHSENEYIGEDGLLHCSVCGRAVQFHSVCEPLGVDKIVRCKCDCKNGLDEFKEREIIEEVERKRRICFNKSKMTKWTFENDDLKNPTISRAMENYVKNFTKFKANGKGLLLYGVVGNGKTYYSACIANSLIDMGYSAKLLTVTEIINDLQGMYEGKKEYIDSLNRYSLLILDDLGAESGSEYQQGIVYNVIDSRYSAGLPFIVTTNLTAEEIKKPSDVRHARIYDRILEKCFPVEVPGTSRRRQNVKETFADVKEKLGL